MKCPICGKTTLPGAKLCGPCRAALKRARDDSVWEVPGSPTAPSAEASSIAAASPARVVLGSGRLASWRGITLAALLVALGVAGGTIITRSGEAAKAPEIATPFQPVTIVQPAAPAAASASAKPAPEPPPAQLVSREEDELVQPPRHDPPRTPKPARPAPEPPAPSVSAPAAEPPAPKLDPPRPAPAPVREPPRAIDPWQRMNEALDRCRAEDLLARLRCEYRVRASFCEGHWGDVPQCPGAPVNDHGQ